LHVLGRFKGCKLGALSLYLEGRGAHGCCNSLFSEAMPTNTNTNTNTKTAATGDFNANWQDDLFGDAMADAMKAAGQSSGRRPRASAGPVDSAYYASQSAADQAVLAAAGWRDAVGSMAIPARLVTADRPTYPLPLQRPLQAGKVRAAHLYDAPTLKRLQDQSRAESVARYNVCAAIAATLARTGKPIAVIDLAALAVAVDLKDSQAEVIQMIARRLNLPMEIRDGSLIPMGKVPASPAHEKYALAFNRAVAKVKSAIKG